MRLHGLFTGVFIALLSKVKDTYSITLMNLYRAGRV